MKLKIAREDEQTISFMNSLIIDKGTYEFMMSIPEKAKLSFWLSMIPVTEKNNTQFKITINNNVLFNEILTNSKFKSWENFSIDLSSYSNKWCKLNFSIHQTSNNIVLLGNPVIYSLNTEAASNKNVILFISDSLRADHLKCYGYAGNTSPEIDAFADDSFKFDYAYAQANNTAPSVSSIISSLYPSAALRFLEDTDSKNVIWYRMDKKIYTMIDAFNDNGYKTAFFTANMVLQYFTPFDLYFHFKQNIKKNTRLEYSSINSFLPNVFNFIDEYKNDKFFLYIHSMDTHIPYAPPESYYKIFLPKNNNTKYDSDAQDFHELFNQKPHTSEELMYLNAFYDGAILYTSKKFNELLDFLKEKGIYENTIIIFTADHGEQFDEHGYFGHGGDLFEEEVRAPLMIKLSNNILSTHYLKYRSTSPYSSKTRIPKNLACFRTSKSVELIDIFPTLIELLGLKMPNQCRLWGTSLVPLMKGINAKYKKSFIFSQNQWRLNKMIKKGKYKYILSGLKFGVISNLIIDNEIHFYDNPKIKEEIYNLSNDTFERSNLIEKFKDTRLLYEFRQIMNDVAAGIRKFNGLKDEEDFLDIEQPKRQLEIEKLKSLGYIQ